MNACDKIPKEHDSEIIGRLEGKVHIEIGDDPIVGYECYYGPHQIGLDRVHLGLAGVDKTQWPYNLRYYHDGQAKVLTSYPINHLQ